jgi:hypothetical protein
LAFRRLPTSLQTVDRYHRALATMGKLAAQQAAPPHDEAKPADPPHLTQPADPDHSYVRVVRDEAAPREEPRPPALRSRSRRARPPARPAAVTTPGPPARPGPNTRIVRDDGPPLAPSSSPASPPSPLEPEPVGRSPVDSDAPDHHLSPGMTAPAPRSPGADGTAVAVPEHAGNGATPPPDAVAGRMLHFDAVDELPTPSGPLGPVSSWAEVAPTEADRGPSPVGAALPGSGRSARDRSRSAGPTFRTSRRGSRRHWAMAAAAVALLVVAAVIGFRLSGETGAHGRPPAQSLRGAPSRPATPVASAQTVPTTVAPSAVLVATSAGSSTYRVDASATISFRAVTGVCWVEVRQAGPYGPVMFTGDLLAGQYRNVNGPVWIRLGNPGVIVLTVNGTSISPPGMTAGQPYDIQFA